MGLRNKGFRGLGAAALNGLGLRLEGFRVFLLAVFSLSLALSLCRCIQRVPKFKSLGLRVCGLITRLLRLSMHDGVIPLNSYYKEKRNELVFVAGHP